jgi:hypothetical protein
MRAGVAFPAEIQGAIGPAFHDSRASWLYPVFAGSTPLNQYPGYLVHFLSEIG